MRPQELMLPIDAFQEKKTLIFDRVFFAPEREDDPFLFPGWSHESLFGNENPVVVEYCSGNGSWIAAKAKQNPHLNWVAVEQKISRGKKIWSKINNFSLPNLIVLMGEGEHSTKRFFPTHSIREIYINFPDPWPKRRHAKNRIVRDSFVAEMARVLQEGSSLTLVTDDAHYSKIMVETVLAHPCFEAVFPPPYYRINPVNFGESYFDTLFRVQGKEIRLHEFKKKKCASNPSMA